MNLQTEKAKKKERPKSFQQAAEFWKNAQCSRIELNRLPKISYHTRKDPVRSLFQERNIANNNMEKSMRNILARFLKIPLMVERSIKVDFDKDNYKEYEVDAISKDIDNRKIIFEFKFFTADKQVPYNSCKTRNNIYLKGGLLSLKYKKRIQGIVITVDNKESDGAVSHLLEQTANSIINRRKDIDRLRIGIKELFEISKYTDFPISPYHQLLLLSNIQQIGYGNRKNLQQLDQLIMPAISKINDLKQFG